MGSAGSIEAVLVDYLQADHAAWGAFCKETDLIDSGWLESLHVMDMVCFVQSRFGIKMAPNDISPSNLRSVQCLARYISGKLSDLADVA